MNNNIGIKTSFLTTGSTFSEKPPQQGFSLVETLVAIIVLSIGMLGIAGLQATSLRLTHDAHLRSQATQLSYDIIARIRSNPTADYSFNGTAPTSSPDCLGNSSSCSPNDIRDYDLAMWSQSVFNQFPDAVPTITATPATDIDYQITITWYDRLEALAQQSDDDTPQAAAGAQPFTLFVSL